MSRMSRKFELCQTGEQVLPVSSRICTDALLIDEFHCWMFRASFQMIFLNFLEQNVYKHSTKIKAAGLSLRSDVQSQTEFGTL